MRSTAPLLLAFLVLSCDSTTEVVASKPGPPLLDAPWTPSQVHQDATFIQEVATTVGSLTDVRAIARSLEDIYFAANGEGVHRWTGTGWENEGIDPDLSANDLAFDDAGVMATAGPTGATVDGIELALPSSAAVAFIAPRQAGGWWLAGTGFAGWWDDAYHPLETLAAESVRAIVDLPDGRWFAATSNGIVTADDTIAEGDGLPSNDVRDLVATSDGTMWAGTAAGLARLEAGTWTPFLGADGLHYGDVTRLAVDADDTLLVSTPMGGSRYHPDGSRRYYFGRTWLPDNDVRGMVRAPDGTVWLATAGGISRVDPTPTTLEAKAGHIDQVAHERHVRLGYTSTENHLETPGDVTTFWNGDDDNDGQWTSMYLASQCFRFAVTGEEQARENARTAAQAMLRLQSVDGLDGFFARSVIPPEECEARQDPEAGEWHLSEDGQWCWKGDTSSDEFVGHMFGLSLYHDLVATDDEKAEIAASMGTLLGGIIDNGYQLLDVDGLVTSHGHFDPEWMHKNLAAQFGDAGLNSAMILGGLHAVYRMTGDSRFRSAFNDLARTEDYADYVRRIEEINTAYLINHDSEEMSFLAMYTLMRYEDDPAWMALWQEGFRHLWEVQRPERNPEFNLMYAALSRGDGYELDEAVETLQKLPLDLVLWGVDHQHRWDREQQKDDDRHGEPQNAFVFPYDERQVMRWSENPYAYEQRGDGTQESSGIFWLLPYWLGRYHGLIE